MLTVCDKLQIKLDETLFKAQPQNKNTTPFHWYSEFYSIMYKDDGSGGFDVVIGNPPYVEYSKIKNYKLYNYNTIKCGNLYAYVMEKSLYLANSKSYIGFIVPISLSATPRMFLLRNQIQDYSNNIWISNFADRPATIFNGVHQKVSICLFNKSIDKNYKLFTQLFHFKIIM